MAPILGIFTARMQEAKGRDLEYAMKIEALGD